MAYKNRIRLPIEIVKPQFPTERTVLSKANGQTVTLAATMKKIYEGRTDWMPEKWHERLAVALNHDTVTLEGDKYLGGVSPEGDYDINWVDFLDYPTAPAAFKVSATPFLAANHNCQSCEEAEQLDLVDDEFPTALDELDSYNLDVSANDTINCYPATFSVSSFNEDYLSAATIDSDGVISITLKSGVIAADGVWLLTYRVTCPNGGYDEANVTGDVSGSVPLTCLEPIGLSIIDVDDDSATAIWNEQDAETVFYWELRDSNYALVQTGQVTGTGIANDITVDLLGLSPGTDYTFRVFSVCDLDAGQVSPVITESFSTLSTGSSSCGSYRVQLNIVESPDSFYNLTYIDCVGSEINTFIMAIQSLTICALQASEGIPLNIVSDGDITITYLGAC